MEIDKVKEKIQTEMERMYKFSEDEENFIEARARAHVGAEKLYWVLQMLND
jgi:hypothetical protein